MKSRRSLIVISGVLLLLLVGVAATLYALPTLARRVAVARLHAITKRPVTIDRVDVKLLSGRITIHGLRVAEPDGGTPFADCELLDARLNLLSLARGHIWVRELVLRKPTLRIVRLERRFNFSDLFEGAETTQKRLDVTVDRFALVDGTVAFEDRALPERRTWTSDDIQIEAHNVSTLRDDGTVVASSITAGAPNLVQIEQFRLYPIHLKATVTVKGLDLALARLYLPADAPVVLDRGRASSILNVTFDARDEVRADLNGELEDLVLVKPGEREPVTRIPKLTTRLTDLTFQHDQVRVGQLEVKGSANVRDPRAQQGARYQISTIRASIADVTWPITTPGRLDVLTAIPGGGTLAVSGMLRPPPAPSQLQLRLRDVDVGAWNRFLPITAKLSGRGEADLRINEPLSAGVPTRVNGSIAVNRLGVRDAREELIGARRVEATGLEVQWPARLGVKRVVVSGPRAIVERDKEGNFPLGALWDRPPAAPTSVPSSDASSSAAKAPRVDVEEIAVRNGVLSWRDETVKPRAALDVSQVDATVTGGGWPLRPVGVRLAVRPPGGGQVQVTGRVGVDPLSADLRVHAREAELAHYQPYVPTRAQFSGRADLDLAVVLPVLSEPQATVRGDAVFSRMDVRDGQRTVMRIGRASVAALDIDWPRSVKARELALRRPWILLERDQSGALPLGALLAPEQAAAAQTPDSAQTSTAPRPSANGSSQPTIPVVLSHLVIEEGGARVVDSGLTPPFAVDIADLASRIDGLSTAPAVLTRARTRAPAGRRRPAQLCRHDRSRHRSAPTRSARRASRIRRAADEPLSAERGGVGSAQWFADHEHPVPDRRRQSPGQGRCPREPIAAGPRRRPRRGASADRPAARHDRLAHERPPRRHSSCASGRRPRPRPAFRLQGADLEHAAPRGAERDHGAGQLDRSGQIDRRLTHRADRDRSDPIRAEYLDSDAGRAGTAHAAGGISRPDARDAADGLGGGVTT